MTESISIKWNNNTTCWYLNGRLHREDGPAIEWESEVSWFYGGDVYSFDEWCEKLNKTIEERAFLKLKYF